MASRKSGDDRAPRDDSAPTLAHALVVSPHLDDAVLSCGYLLARHPGTTVATVFAGFPPPRATVTSWDARCGFGPGDDVGASRQAEDDAALGVLGASAVRLPFPDDQYRARGEQAEPRFIAAALTTVAEKTGARAVVAPLGLFHRDHELTHHAALLTAQRAGLRLTCYADVPYRTFSQDDECARVRQLEAQGFRCRAARSPAADTDDDAAAHAWRRKRDAVQCYESQLRGLTADDGPGIDDAFAPEAYVLTELAS